MTRATQFTHYGGILAATAFGRMDQIATDMTLINLHQAATDDGTPNIFGFDLTQRDETARHAVDGLVFDDVPPPSGLWQEPGVAWNIGQDGRTTEEISGAVVHWRDDGATVGYDAVLTASIYGDTPSGLTYGRARGIVEVQSIEGGTGEGGYKHQIGFDLRRNC